MFWCSRKISSSPLGHVSMLTTPDKLTLFHKRGETLTVRDTSPFLEESILDHFDPSKSKIIIDFARKNGCLSHFFVYFSNFLGFNWPPRTGYLVLKYSFYLVWVSDYAPVLIRILRKKLNCPLILAEFQQLKTRVLTLTIWRLSSFLASMIRQFMIVNISLFTYFQPKFDGIIKSFVVLSRPTAVSKKIRSLVANFAFHRNWM